MTPDDPRLLLRAAADLFNRGEYLAAHEVLDELWEATEGPDADFYKGLIQASVAMHHLVGGNVEGAAKLHRGQRRLLGPYLPQHRGVDVAALLESMQATLRAATRGEDGPGASARPRIELAEEPAGER